MPSGPLLVPFLDHPSTGVVLVEGDSLGSPTPVLHLVLRQLYGLFQRRQAVALDPLGGLPRQPSHELVQNHFVDDFLDVTFLGHQPSAAGVLELLHHHEGSATVFKVQRSKTLVVLL